MTAPLPWVKLHTKIISSPKWRSLPIADRGVFLHLVALAGANGTPGVIEGTDSDLAELLGVSARDLRTAVDRLARTPHESVKRTESGLIITKWAEYQPAQASLSHAQRGRPATVPVARVDKRREDQSRDTVAVLEEIEKLPGWKADLSRDIELVEELAAKFPTIDLASSVRGLGNWLEDGGQTGNVRNSLRNRVAKSFEFGRDLKSAQQDWRDGLTPDQIRERLRVVS